jgi:glutamyl-tRNA synthetase
VISYKDEGIVPEAFRNFLALLGWTAPEGSPEKLGDQELIRLFSLEGISHSNAVFDRPKLDWFNTEYIRAYPAGELLPLIEDEWGKVGLKPASSDREHLLATIELLKPRARNLKDFASSFRAYFTDEYANDPAAVEKFLKDDVVRTMLVELGTAYSQAAEFTEASTEQVLRDFANAKGVKAGALINGSRVALTGQAVAPSLFAVMVNLGKEKTVSRLKRAKDIR